METMSTTEPHGLYRQKPKHNKSFSMNAYEEYKKKLGETRPWDALNPNKFNSDETLSTKRYEICEGCPRFFKITKQCKECGCFMPIKTKLTEAVCPLGKW